MTTVQQGSVYYDKQSFSLGVGLVYSPGSLESREVDRLMLTT